jgi:membrane protein DedA with SNARE-associated domain
LAYAGLKAGENWQSLKIYFEKFDYLIVGVLILMIIWWIWHHLKAADNK